MRLMHQERSMGYSRIHRMAWADGTNYNDISLPEKVLQNTFTDGFIVPVPAGATAVTLYCNVVSKQSATEINIKLEDSPDGAMWSPAQARTNETIAPPDVSYDMLDTVYNIKGVADGMVKAFVWSCSMAEFIKISIKGDGSPSATFKGIFIFEVLS